MSTKVSLREFDRATRNAILNAHDGLRSITGSAHEPAPTTQTTGNDANGNGRNRADREGWTIAYRFDALNRAGRWFRYDP